MTEHQELNRLGNLINNFGFELAQTNEDLLEVLAKHGATPNDYHFKRTSDRIKRIRTLTFKKF